MFCFVFFGGFKGQVRWPEDLALSPPYFVFFVFFGGGFPFLAFNRQQTCFPPRKGHFLFILESPPLFLLSLFWPPPFSVSRSLSLSLSLSLSCSFLSFFLLVFLVCFLLALRFSLFFSFCCLLYFSFMKGTTSKFNCNFFFSSIFSLC